MQNKINWPHPDAFKDLIVEEASGGFAFSAPEGSECAKWLDHYNQNEELRQEFGKAIIETLLKNLEKDKSCGPT